MTESTIAVNNFFQTVLAVISGSTVCVMALIYAYAKLKHGIDSAINKTDDNRKSIEELHKTVNSQQSLTDLKRKQEADEKKDLAVKVATMEAERLAVARADLLSRSESQRMLTEAATALTAFRAEAERHRVEAAAVAAQIADLRAQLATAQISPAIVSAPAAVVATGPTEVTVVNPDPIPVLDVTNEGLPGESQDRPH